MIFCDDPDKMNKTYYESECRRFESSWARQQKQGVSYIGSPLVFYVILILSPLAVIFPKFQKNNHPLILSIDNDKDYMAWCNC